MNSAIIIKIVDQLSQQRFRIAIALLPHSTRNFVIRDYSLKGFEQEDIYSHQPVD